MRELLFSVTKKDLTVQTFKSGGKGGQHQNTCNSGVRIIHPPSGARSECRQERSQAANKKLAFRRLVSSTAFLLWQSRMIACYGVSIEKKVEEAMADKNLKIEYGGVKWRNIN